MSLADTEQLTARARGLTDWSGEVGTDEVTRGGTLVATLVLISSFTLVLRDIVATVGSPRTLTLVVIAAVLAATVTWPLVTIRQTVRAGLVTFLIALLLYGFAVPVALRPTFALQGTLDLVTGRSALWIVRVELWALLVTPVPVFLTWLFALERQYVRAAAVGGAALCFLVLSGDAGLLITLLGVVAAGAVVGLGDVMRRAESLATVDSLLIVLGVMVVTPFLVSVVPGGAAGPLGLGSDDTTTMEENVVTADGSLEILGSIEQTADVRFLASGEEPRYWRTGSYDRYTGDGWIRAGESRSGTGGLAAADGETASYEISARTSMSVLPAPWQPVGLDGVDQVSVEPDGTPTLDGTLDSGEEYTVNSTVRTTAPEVLAEAEGAYPADIEQRYTQLPASTSERVAERTRSIAVNAETPYETAAVVERWLENNREYSLDVDRPDGDIVEAFLFDMDQGYCTYYATAMVGMLRSVDIPARLAVGYTTGDSIDEDTWAVRGSNSHAWVEVYVPDHGWVQFDPTPAGPREAVENQATGDPGSGADPSGTDDEGEADTGGDAETAPGTQNESSTDLGNDTAIDEELPAEGTADPSLGGEDALRAEDSPETSDNGTDIQVGNVTENGTEDSGQNENNRIQVSPGDIDPRDGGTALLELPAYQHALLATLALAGLGAVVRRSPVPEAVAREAAMRFQRRRDPETDIERAHERLLLVLAKRHRPRAAGETTRQYLDAIGAGSAARRLAAIHEHARYAGEYSEEAADEAVDLVDQVRGS
jgi:transglutaminase-like putative cysteine protease